MGKLQIGATFHTTTTCLCDDIGAYINKLARDSQMIGGLCVDGTSSLGDFQREINTGAQGYGVYRCLTDADDVPRYGTPVKEEAARYIRKINDHWPPELDKSLFYVELINEPNKLESDWLGYFMVELGRQMMDNDYNFAGPGWSTGEPEPEHNRTPGMLAWFRLCAAHPGRLAHSVHEYAIDDKDGNEQIMAETVPWLMGRCRDVNRACIENGITPPDVLITEFGWNYRTAPSWNRGVPQIIEMLHWYIEHVPNVKLFALWTLGRSSQWGDIPKTIHPYMTPLANNIIATDWAEPIDPDPPFKPIKFVEFLYPQEFGKWNYKRVAVKAWNEYKRSLGASVDHAIAVMKSPRASAESYVVVWHPGKPSQQNAIAALRAAGVNYEVRYLDVPPKKFPETLKLGFLFQWRYRLTSPFNAPRSYGNGFHEGIDYNIIGGRADNNVSVLCAYPGTVESARLGSSYGLRVRIRHELEGNTFYTWYCHLDEIYVQDGDLLDVGDAIGEVGDTGNANGEHIHFNLVLPGHGLSGYVIDHVVDPAPYLPDPSGLPLYQIPHQNLYDVLDYMLGDRRMFEVRHGDGQTETFQCQEEGSNIFYLVKNSQYETMRYDNEVIWRGIDTSPGKGRYYIQYEAGMDMARWVARKMYVGQTFTGYGHTVQFFMKDTCLPSQANSGPATNGVTLVDHHPIFIRNGITLNDVIELGTNTGETMFFARGYGLVAWENSEGGQSAISEILSGRDDLIRETGCFSI